jgi:hypothetical protein
MFILTIIFCLSMLIFAQENAYNQEFQIYQSMYTDNGYPQISALSNGYTIICWENSGLDGDGYGIFARLLDSNGKFIGHEFPVNFYIKNGQRFPHVASLLHGDFIIVWQSGKQDGNNYGIFAQRFDSNGQKLGKEIQVNTYFQDGQSNPRVAALKSGGFIVCWVSREQDGDDCGIFAQQFTPDGKKMGMEVQVNTYYLYDQRHPNIVTLSNGNYIICWESRMQDGSDYGIFAQLFTADGYKIGEEIPINSYTDNWQGSPCVCSLTEGNFIVCWHCWRQDGDQLGIFARSFNFDGTPSSGEFQVNRYTYGQQGFPSIAALDNDNIMICWQSFGQDGSDWGIYAQLLDNRGKKLGSEFRVNTDTQDEQSCPSVAVLGKDGFQICWHGLSQHSNRHGIWVKYFLADANVHELHPFDLIEPGNDSYIETTIPIFKWQSTSNGVVKYPWEMNYDLYISEDPGFVDPTIYFLSHDTYFRIFPDKLHAGHTYYWKVLAKNIKGDSLWSNNSNGFFIAHDAIPTGVEDAAQTSPTHFVLGQNYPNPFNPTTTVPIILAEQSRVTIKVYNSLGQVGATLAQDQSYAAGRQQFVFDGTGLAAGIYFVRAEIVTNSGQKYRLSHKMLMIK